MTREHLRLGMVGLVTLDYTYSVSSHPGRETQVPMLATATVVGGMIGRAALAVARLGSPVAVFATCGSDEVAAELKRTLAAEAVTCTWVESEGPSQRSVVISSLDDGSRSIIWKPQPFATPDVRDRVASFLDGLDVVLLDSTDPVLSALTGELCRQRGITTILDTSSGRPWTADLLAHIDHVLASHKYTSKVVDGGGERAARTLIDPRRNTVFAVTEAGEGGVWVSSAAPSTVSRWPAFEVNVVDSCGAGDVFHGVYAWGIARRLDVADALHVASCAAALSTTALGNAALPSFEELMAALPPALATKVSGD